MRPTSSKTDSDTAEEDEDSENTSYSTTQKLHPASSVRCEETSSNSEIDYSDKDVDYIYDNDSGKDDNTSKEGSIDDEITFKINDERKAANLNKGNRVRWVERDTNAVKDYFRSFIEYTSKSHRTGPLPGKQIMILISYIL
ncbi:uncharacterized protein LOC117339678 isoform X1 [Pecten maximus]|uniref:uncharacterized protein LOC117339678 isoform X1 n=1 Tax=Pecten maximus TaxID=6579 RepID=UPI0014587451|nr:uncharacterized protein LOC117339678 isoform X1 [Pecten maximus]